MAVDITIHFSDAEQAKVSEFVDLLKPGLSNAEKKALLETLARKLLRDDLVARVSQVRNQQVTIQNDADRQAIAATDPLAPTPPPAPPIAPPPVP